MSQINKQNYKNSKKKSKDPVKNKNEIKDKIQRIVRNKINLQEMIIIKRKIYKNKNK